MEMVGDRTVHARRSALGLAEQGLNSNSSTNSGRPQACHLTLLNLFFSFVK